MGWMRGFQINMTYVAVFISFQFPPVHEILMYTHAIHSWHAYCEWSVAQQYV